MNKNITSVQISLVEIKADRPIIEDAEKLRGYIAHKFPEWTMFHNHIGDKVAYGYAKIQYKMIDGIAYILGINEGAELTDILLDIDILTLGKNTYNVKITIYNKEENLSIKRDMMQYQLLSPILPLNQENYLEYRNMSQWNDRKMFINKLIRDNIVAMCKGLSFDLTSDIYVHSRLKETRVRYKPDLIFTGFLGQFRSNVYIPNLFGICQGNARGYGIVQNEGIYIKE
jgi:hypothetical protein